MTATAMNILSGYGIKIRAPRRSDLEMWTIDLGESEFADCVAIDGEDVGACLAAVVDLKRQRVVWSDTAADSSTVTPIPKEQELDVVLAVARLINSFLPVEAGTTPS